MPPTNKRCIAITISKKQCRNEATPKGSDIFCTVHRNHKNDTIHHIQQTELASNILVEPDDNTPKSCLDCKGSGKKTVISLSSKEKITKFIECVGCSGKGTMTKDELDKYNFTKNMWCKCKDGDNLVVHHNRIQLVWAWCVTQEHWHCLNCKKIVEIINQ
jgi:hypothetical protein